MSIFHEIHLLLLYMLLLGTSFMKRGSLFYRRKIPIHLFTGTVNYITVLTANLYSFVFSLMGKGIIEMAPDKVYETLRNPRTRYTYDNLLKVCTCVYMFVWLLTLFPSVNGFCEENR